MSGDVPPKSKSRRKSKGVSAHVVDDPIDDTFDAMLDSASKITNRATSSKQKLGQTSMGEGSIGWSHGDENVREHANPPPVIPRGIRRVAEEIIATDIPTIPMNEADDDDDDAIDMAPQVAVAPEFSVHQVASFKEIEREFALERASQYIDPKIDIGILYHNIHLQEDVGEEDSKPWNWDKIFVEIRNAVTNPTIES